MAEISSTMAAESKVETASLTHVPDGVYAYVAVKGSLHAADCTVFGLSPDERLAISKRFPGGGVAVINGLLIKGVVLDVINSLGELSYRVVSSTGEAEITWTMQREV